MIIVSFGLVLLATILLIVGLLNDTVPLIVGSIIASASAAIVLVIASRMARPKKDQAKQPPEPIEVDPAPAVDGGDASREVDGDDEPTTAMPVAAAAAAAPSATPEAAPAPAGGSEWMADDDWAGDDEVVDFPIADYDVLTVGEIMPLLPQLYSDELDMVIEREQAGRNRSSIIRRLEELKVSGTDADREEAGVAPVAASATAAPPSAAPTSSTVDDEDLYFPIADYDSLNVGQIVPLLSQLEPDERDDVRARELSGAGRKTVLAELDRLSGDDSVDAVSTPASRGAAAFPIAGYDDLNVADVKRELLGLSPDELQAVRDREASGAGRATLLRELDRRLADSGAEQPSPASGRSSGGSRSSSKRASRSAKRFPIANYDDLTVADIRPRLAKLSETQLEQVREREVAGAGRKTILKEIDSRLT